MANHPQNGDLPAYPSTNEEEYLAALTMQAGATYVDDGGNHPRNGDLPPYPTTNVEEYLAYLVQAGLGKVTKGYMYNGNFYEDLAHTKLITPKEGSIYYDVNENKMYVYLNAQYHAISSSQVGRFLSSWNAQTGLPTTNPGTVPYTYHTGDYYMITNVGTTNYKPSGSTYTGTASTTTETGNISDNDFYFYDGTTWFLLKNSHPEIPAVVQSTGTSTTSVMSQDAVTKNIGRLIELSEDDYNYPVDNPTCVALGLLPNGIYTRANSSIAIDLGDSSELSPMHYACFIISSRSNGQAGKNLIALASANVCSIQFSTAYYRPNEKQARGVIHVTRPIDDLTTSSSIYSLSAKQGKVLKDLIDSYLTSGAGAPTTATVGTVGKLYQDTTNGKLYHCTAINEGAYIWSEVGASIVQTTGTSTTDVMSQNAATGMIFGDTDTRNNIRVGKNVTGTGNRTIAIGQNITANAGTSVFIGYENSSSFAGTSDCTAIGSYARTPNYTGGTAIGGHAYVASSMGTAIGYYAAINSNDHHHSVALGDYSTVTAKGQVSIGGSELGTNGYNNSQYRLLSNVYDPQNDHDAANKEYVDGNVGKFRFLTDADKNYPTAAPDGIAIWLLDEGIYCFDSGVKIYFLSNFSETSTKNQTVIVGQKDSYNNKTCIYLGGLTLNVYRVSSSGSGNIRSLSYTDQIVNTLTSVSTSSPLAANQGKVLKDLIDSYLVSGAGAPTTATVGTVGKLYLDTTNGELYQCTAVSGSTYTWTKVGGPNVVQTTGTSTTDVMSQNAVTNMVFADNNMTKIRIGDNSQTSNPGGIAIGNNSRSSGWASNAIGSGSKANGFYQMAIGPFAQENGASLQGAIALGACSQATYAGEMNIGSTSTSYGYNSSNYRLLTGLYDGQNAHDAATKGQLDNRIISGGTTAPTTATVGVVGQLYTYYDTTNSVPVVMMCTAVSGSTYTWTDILGSVANQLAQL